MVTQIAQTLMLAAMAWVLVVPTEVPQSGTANASPAPIATNWSTFTTYEACENQRVQLADDPVVGERMKAAHCVETGSTQPAASPSK